MVEPVTVLDFQRPRALLDRYGLRPKHSFGQNFLADAHVAERIAALAVPTEGADVIEIGAGLGALTGWLTARSRRVLAIERDRDLVPILRELFRAEVDQGRVSILAEDAKRFDFAGAFAGATHGRYIAGNLPYNLTGPLLERFCALAGSVDGVCLLVQLEVAERLRAQPGSAAYGALTVFVSARFDVARELVVRRGSFYPQPRVDSAVVRLTPLETPRAEETTTFQQVVSGAFHQRRKTLRNAWRGIAGRSTVAVEEAAARATIDLARRGETLTVDEFARMTAELDR